ncbi:MAG TPA: response regulator [Mycobacteriales bacterium]|nr:response regulator [Mycobacteriales bacterium]
MTTVLVVDDAADIRLLQRAVLGRSGYVVEEAASGPAALAALAKDPIPDIVVLDIQMPVMDGWDTLAAIRADPRLVDLPVILCTVKSRPEDTERAWRAGCDGYLGKPFSITNLVEEVETALARSPEQRAAVRRTWLSAPSIGG